MVDAFVEGDILQVLLVALLFGFALSALGQRANPLLALLDAVTQAIFTVVNFLVRLAATDVPARKLARKRQGLLDQLCPVPCTSGH